MDLDRFSQPMSWEYRRRYDDPFIEPEEEGSIVPCSGCGELIFKNIEEWEEIDTDEIVHRDHECVEMFFEKEKRAAGQGNSRG
ncbi:hypothetical protein ACSU64_27785 [Bacillaceae bacterium C204]|uniref:hypothetical protein n=1 Tax=Neobacillus sp. 204 TaxID=3383351 RepID=UPI0039789F1C